MPRRFLRGSTVRLLLTIVALASGVALVCAIDLVNRAVSAAFTEILDTMAGRASLQVDGGEGALVPESLADTVKAVSGVELAVPVVSSWAFLAGGSGEHLAVHGVDITNDDAIRVYEPAGTGAVDLGDPLEFLAQRDSVMVTETFAQRHGLAVGDAIEIETPTGRRRLVVRALLAATGMARAQGGNVLVMDVQSAELAFTKRGMVNRIDVVVRRDARLDAVREAIATVVPAGYRVEPPLQRRIDLHRIIGSVQTLLQAVSMIGLVAAFLIAFSRLSTVFEARVGQLAILRAVGVRRSWVHRELLQETLLIGVAGVALGVPLGIGLAHLLLPVIATATAIGAKVVTAETVIRVRPQSVGLAIATGLAAVIAAAVLPARRAARSPIVETLRGLTVEADTDHPPRRLLALAIVVAAAVASHLVVGEAVLGLAASAAIVVVAVMASRPLLQVCAAPLTGLAPRLGGGAGHFAVASMLRAPRRTALTVATIGVGFGAVLWLWTLATSFERSIVEVMPGVLRADLVIGSVDIGTGYIEAPLDDGILAEIAATPGVQSVVGEQTADWTHGGGPVALNAFDPAYFDEQAYGPWRFVGRALPDANPALARGEAALVSENFVHNIGGRVGETLTLDTPVGPVALRIAGVVADFLSPRGTIIVSRTLYRERWQSSHVTHALVRMTPGADRGALRAAIAARIGTKHHVRILDVPELIAWFTEQARRAFASLHVLGALVLIVVLVGVGDSLAAGVLERTRDLGVVRALGARRRVLGHIVVAEAVMLALLGVALATVLGLGLGLMWVKATFPALIGWTLSLHLPSLEATIVIMGALAVCLMAAHVPARRAAHLDPVVALRTE
jgi:putative ABC transport system permease protein